MKHKSKYLYLILYLISFLVFYNFPFREVFKWEILPGIEEAKGTSMSITSNATTTDGALPKSLIVSSIKDKKSY